MKKIVIIEKESKEQEEANIEKEVKQGCNSSPMLFNLYNKEALVKVREEGIGGIYINGMLVQMLPFVDCQRKVKKIQAKY